VLIVVIVIVVMMLAAMLSLFTVVIVVIVVFIIAFVFALFSMLVVVVVILGKVSVVFSTDFVDFVFLQIGTPDLAVAAVIGAFYRRIVGNNRIWSGIVRWLG